nr:MAG TPA: hypothetical protein [Bacteriophage sp.]
MSGFQYDHFKECHDSFSRFVKENWDLLGELLVAKGLVNVHDVEIGDADQSTIEGTRNYAKQRNAAPVPVLEPILPLPVLRDLVRQRPGLL